MPFSLSLWPFAILAAGVAAQYPPDPKGLINQQVHDHPEVTISYKETCICETEARAWAGYVHMPTSYLSDIETNEPYNVSMFFWYFEARNSPESAPTAIYLAGGPGEPGVSGAVYDGGPCTVLEDGNSTVINPFSWNTDVNMLYLDQPVGTGFSYTKAVNSTLDLLFLGTPITDTGITPFSAYNGSVPEANSTFLHGTFSEQDPAKTVNSTMAAAKTLWHFSQAWFSSFPEYRTRNKNLNLMGNSYGGFWAPVFAEYVLKQNDKIAERKIKGTSIHIDTVAWTNGCVDEIVQAEWYPDQAYNNTYGLQVIPKDVFEDSKLNFTKPGGCRDLILECRALGDQYDPDNLNANATVNEACVDAFAYCETYVAGAYDVLSNRSDFDMRNLKPDPSPPAYWYAYFQNDWVLEDLGVPVNFTTTSLLANNVFLYSTGDPIRTAGLKSVEYLLARGVKVAMMYGDADYRCPWIGGEKLSLAAQWTGAADFEAAGFEYVHTNATYEGGVVRQHGNLSYTRIFDSGHDAQWYQPETVFHLFNRAIFNKDLATGQHSTQGAHNDYSSKGPSSSFGIKNKLLDPPPFRCELFAVSSSCTIEQYEALANGTAEIVDFNVVNPVGVTPGSLLGIL